MKTTFYLFLICAFFTVNSSFSQGSPDYNGGFKVKLDEEGKKHLRFISWVQGQVNYNFDATGNTEALTMQLRRARLLLYAKITPKFMILTHFGVNSLNGNTLSPTGKGEGSQVFLHDAWAQYNFTKNFTMGVGLHYFNGISRLSNQSTLNMLTLDNNRSSWATLGLSDQFARHIGVFAKGNFDKFQYQLAINSAMVKTLDERTPTATIPVYRGKELLGKDAGKTFAGYFQYSFLDTESNFLPFKVGSYLGGKKVFNIGAGFFAHPNGAVVLDGSGNPKGEDVSIFAIDAFYDAPLSNNGSAITAYAVYQNNNYGKNYAFGPYGTGSMLYAHVGYLFGGEKTQVRFQPYTSFSTNKYEASNDSRNRLGLGVNAYLSGHNAKFTLEYDNQSFGSTSTSGLTLQAMIYL